MFSKHSVIYNHRDVTQHRSSGSLGKPANWGDGATCLPGTATKRQGQLRPQRSPALQQWQDNHSHQAHAASCGLAGQAPRQESTGCSPTPHSPAGTQGPGGHQAGEAQEGTGRAEVWGCQHRRMTASVGVGGAGGGRGLWGRAADSGHPSQPSAAQAGSAYTEKSKEPYSEHAYDS